MKLAKYCKGCQKPNQKEHVVVPVAVSDEICPKHGFVYHRVFIDSKGKPFMLTVFNNDQREVLEMFNDELETLKKRTDVIEKWYNKVTSMELIPGQFKSEFMKKLTDEEE